MGKFQTPYATRLIQGLTQKTGHILQYGYLYGSATQSPPRCHEPLSQLRDSGGSGVTESAEPGEPADLNVYIDLELDTLMARVQLISYRYILL